jgi:hypothetical protein
MKTIPAVAAVVRATSRPVVLALLTAVGLSSTLVSVAEMNAPYPVYKPASRAPEPIDIRSNTYGASRSAPDALRIGERVPDFTVPRVGGGNLALESVRAQGDVVIIFYRGHW